MNQIAKVKGAVAGVRVRPMSTQVAEVRQNINLIQEAMKATMKKDVHYGVIPGCQKPSLYKPGAEVIIALFRLSTDPVVTDLSKDGEIRYQVKVNITNRENVFIGSGIGECSSGEEKYMWRASICQEEYESTAENMRRIKFKKNYNAPVSEVQQVRVNPSDMANTILKMAKKRALIDAVLTATGASDIFAQDIEDLPEGFVQQENQSHIPSDPAGKPENEVNEQPQDASPLSGNAPNPQDNNKNDDYISEPQRKRLYAISKGSKIPELSAWLLDNYGIESSKNVLKSDYEKICTAAANYKP